MWEPRGARSAACMLQHRMRKEDFPLTQRGFASGKDVQQRGQSRPSFCCREELLAQYWSLGRGWPMAFYYPCFQVPCFQGRNQHWLLASQAVVSKAPLWMPLCQHCQRRAAEPRVWIISAKGGQTCWRTSWLSPCKLETGSTSRAHLA